MDRALYLLVAFLAPLGLCGQSLYFPPTAGSTWDTISPQSLGWCPHKVDSLYAYLDTNRTRAFILLKDGKIVLEKYFGTHTPTTPWQWASAGKTITAFMVGIAQQENLLSIADTTSHYLGQGWTNCTPAQEEKITIRHQLTMTAGLDDGAPDPFCTLDTCLTCAAEAGTRWAYHNGPYTLLDGVLASATGTTLNAYTTQKLKNPTGMTGAFIPIGFNNVFFSNARSMARFGLLILNRGNWNGHQLMTDTAFFAQMVNTSQPLNRAYGYLWWLNGKPSYMLPGTQFVFNGLLSPHAPADMFVAMGKDGQLLNIAPSTNVVWLRMGDSPDGVPVPALMNDVIWSYINDLACTTTGLHSSQNEHSVRMYPNPGKEVLHLEADFPIVQVEMFNARGQRIKILSGPAKEMRISIRELPRGLYLIKADVGNGSGWIGKLLKE